MKCRACGTELVALTSMNREWDLMVCPNWTCSMYSQPQGCNPKVTPAPVKPRPIIKSAAAKETQSKRQKANYRILRDICKLPSRQAARMTSNKMTQLALQGVKQ